MSREAAARWKQQNRGRVNARDNERRRNERAARAAALGTMVGKRDTVAACMGIAQNLGAMLIYSAKQSLERPSSRRDWEDAMEFLYPTTQEGKDHLVWAFGIAGCTLHPEQIAIRLAEIRPPTPPEWLEAKKGAVRQRRPRVYKVKVRVRVLKPCPHCKTTEYAPHGTYLDRNVHVQKCFRAKYGRNRKRVCWACGDMFSAGFLKNEHFKKHVLEVGKGKTVPCLYCGEFLTTSCISKHRCPNDPYIKPEGVSVYTAGTPVSEPLREAHAIGEALPDQGSLGFQVGGWLGCEQGSDTLVWPEAEAAISRPREDHACCETTS